MDGNQELALAQMRRSVQQLGGDTEGYGNLTLMRFLVARSVDLEKAAKMFVEWQQWRTSFVPGGRIPESEIQYELGCEKIYLQGLSRKGLPVLIVKGGKHYPSKDQLQFKKFIVHILDKTIESGFKGQEIGNEKLVGIIDMKHIYLKNLDTRGLITSFQFLQAYYPERLAKAFLVNMPRFFVHVWRFVCRFLEKATLEKIVVVTNEEEQRDFVAEIGEDTLPEEYGGRAKPILLQDFPVSPLHHPTTD